MTIAEGLAAFVVLLWVGFFIGIVLMPKVRGHRLSPSQLAAEANRYDLIRGCGKCGSAKYRYVIVTDEIVCAQCGSTDRVWMLAHPELSDTP